MRQRAEWPGIEKPWGERDCGFMREHSKRGKFSVEVPRGISHYITLDNVAVISR